jgi:hypothetical protein
MALTIQNLKSKTSDCLSGKFISVKSNGFLGLNLGAVLGLNLGSDIGGLTLGRVSLFRGRDWGRIYPKIFPENYFEKSDI